MNFSIMLIVSTVLMQGPMVGEEIHTEIKERTEKKIIRSDRFASDYEVRLFEDGNKTQIIDQASGSQNAINPHRVELVITDSSETSKSLLARYAGREMSIKALPDRLVLHGEYIALEMGALIDILGERVSALVFEKSDGPVINPNDPLFPVIDRPICHGDCSCWPGQSRLGETGVLTAWNKTRGRPQIVMAVIDSSFDIDHEDLVGNLWVNEGEIPNNNHDDDGNGKADDIHGWNFEADDPDVRTTQPNGSYATHGTRTAGVAVARSNNGLGVAGVAGGWGALRGVAFMALKSGEDGNLLVGNGPQALIYAARNGAHVANASWGGGIERFDPAFFEHLAEYYGMTVVCAAGDGDVTYPARFPTTIAVTKNTNVPYGQGCEVLDVGVTAYLPTTDPTGFDNCKGDCWRAVCQRNIFSQSTREKYFPNYSGSSASAPFVSGIVGLMLSVNEGLSWQQVKEILRQTASHPQDRDCFNGSGIVNAAAAVNLAEATSTVRVLSPNGGEIIPAGSDLEIEWQNYGSPGSELRLELIRDMPEFMDTTVVASTVVNNSVGGWGQAMWPLPFMPEPGNYRIRISSDGTLIRDYSDRSFTITESQRNIHSVTYGYDQILNPSTVYHGQNITIRYTSEQFLFSDRGTINLLGGTVETIHGQAALHPTQIHEFNWRVDTEQLGYAILRVSYNNDPGIGANSFGFQLEEPRLEVLEPSQTQPSSGQMGIEWDWLGEPCRIELTLMRNQNEVASIGAMNIQPGPGSMTWPYSLPTGDGYRVRIETTDRASNLTAFGPTFSIDSGTGGPSLSIVRPADGAQFQAGQLITFEGNATDPVDGDLSPMISWTADNGLSSFPLGTGALFSANLEPGTWNITARVTNSQGSSTAETITIGVGTQPLIKIVSPEDGQIFGPGAVILLRAELSPAATNDLVTWYGRRGLFGRHVLLGQGLSLNITLDDGTWIIDAVHGNDLARDTVTIHSGITP